MANLSRFNWFFRAHLPDEDMPLSAELRFAEALAELPAIERSALALSEIGGLGTDEIAERLGTDVAVVRKLLVRARQTVRTTIEVSGRRSLSALIPFQNWWNSGSTAPAVRAAGAVAAAVIGTGVAIGGAAADPPRPALFRPIRPSSARSTAHGAVRRRRRSRPSQRCSRRRRSTPRTPPDLPPCVPRTIAMATSARGPQSPGRRTHPYSEATSPSAARGPSSLRGRRRLPLRNRVFRGRRSRSGRRPRSHPRFPSRRPTLFRSLARYPCR